MPGVRDALSFVGLLFEAFAFAVFAIAPDGRAQSRGRGARRTVLSFHFSPGVLSLDIADCRIANAGGSGMFSKF